MEHLEERTFKRTEKVRVKLTCDLCGREQERYGHWTKDSYGVCETHLYLRTGSAYPEGGSGDEIVVDICDKCFLEKLLPWLEKQGVKPALKEWDF